MKRGIGAAGERGLTRVRLLLACALALAALVLAFPAAAWAHVPVLEPSTRSDQAPKGGETYPGAHVIEGPDASRAVYGYLAEGEKFDAYRFTVKAKVTTTVGVLVPVARGTDLFRPKVSVLINDHILGEVGWPNAPATSFYEPFSFQTLYQGDEQRFTFEPGQTYVLIVEKGDSSVAGGPYVVSFSGGEVFGPDDIGRSLVALPRIWLGLYGQAPFNPLPLVVLAGIAVLIGLIVSAIRERKRLAILARRTVRRR